MIKAMAKFYLYELDAVLTFIKEDDAMELDSVDYHGKSANVYVVLDDEAAFERFSQLCEEIDEADIPLTFFEKMRLLFS